MCGIAGIVSHNPSNINVPALKKMADTIAYRGPDGEGFWINDEHTVGFAHRRLSIIDLSAEASQPMHFSPPEQPQRYTIIYNGEIYNYLEIREELFSRGYQFRNRCDTEVILAAYDCYKEDCLQYLDGMFAFAIWDEKEQTLFMARDRFGEKPFFYWYNEHKGFYFASEMKALWAAGIEKQVDEQALLYYLALGFTQFANEKEKTFYSNIKTIPPAHYIQWNIRHSSFKAVKYWDIDNRVQKDLGEAETLEKFRSLFFTSVKRRLRSDVLTGTSLSGGLDSSSIVSVINNIITTADYKSFSAVFPGYEKDESAYINEMATTFGLDDYRVAPTAEDFMNGFDTLCYHHEQPFGSAGVYTQYAVCRLAKQHDTKVLLDGQGADEILAGYSKYLHWYLQELISSGKFAAFSKEKTALQRNSQQLNWNYKNYISAYTPALTASLLEKRTYKNLKNNTELNAGFIQANNDINKVYKPEVHQLNDILYFDTMVMGLEELLRNADRNAMAHGIELRLPFLSHELVEFIFSLPVKYKIQQGYTKWILRESVKYIIPASIVWRKDKVGFEPPQKMWMNQPALTERIREAKQHLSIAGILKKEVADTRTRSTDAYHRKNFDWRYLVAANLLKKA
ncbi:MAG: asparagine synthase (glutamine-hydrolyzing) [Chitinophagaceae bacterium]|nr:asparagine synthase (glutamine-hydrolyzing) [Chitinophagaceae bacterium]